jgi:poly-gamma-glutamate synthesis protein (capsule biosynthesis protein)
VNFEGAATTAFVAHEPKRHLLRMPLGTPAALAEAGISAVTLANNHAMDFGFQGVFDTLVGLQKAGIEWTGAGRTKAEAVRPILLHTPKRTVCLLAFSRTLPESFWATSTKPGTAFAAEGDMTSAIGRCAATGAFPLVAIHWGQELAHKPAPYQRTLARAAIDAGAGAVIGHHPHVTQGVEVYKGRLIVYSLGNFAFGSLPSGPPPQGLAARLFFDTADNVRWELVPLNVDNADVAFRPRPFKADEAKRAAQALPKAAPCTWSAETLRWTCRPSAP